MSIDQLKNFNRSSVAQVNELLLKTQLVLIVCPAPTAEFDLCSSRYIPTQKHPPLRTKNTGSRHVLVKAELLGP
uniref:Uncharacterized protein n=1 Tax=Moniliophthora roreri TaxID=221103 RepID=A0A0W0G0J5_MONRR